MDVTPIITLLTDFGSQDTYVGVMHGVTAGIAPQARVVDLTHAVSPQAVAEAAYLLDEAAPFFPQGTIHVAVVDPGVGTARRIVCARTAGATYLAPDNGLLTRVLERDPPLTLTSVEARKYFLPSISTTFHGRDIFAPVAAHLANGVLPGALGPALGQPVTLDLPRPRDVGPGRTLGEVVHVDRFGNLITNLAVADLGEVVSLQLGSATIPGPTRRSYAERPEGELLLVSGSSGFLEVAVNAGSARERLQAARGAVVEVTARRPAPAAGGLAS